MVSGAARSGPARVDGPPSGRYSLSPDDHSRPNASAHTCARRRPCHATALSRLLLVTIRVVEDADRPMGDAAWPRLRAAVQAIGGRAWRFRQRGAPRRYIEFLEWIASPGVPDLPDRTGIAAALAALDRTGTIETREIWEETP